MKSADYIKEPAPEKPKVPSENVVLRKAVTEALSPILAELPSMVAQALQVSIEKLIDRPSRVENAEDISKAVTSALSNLALPTPEVHIEQPESFKLASESIEQIRDSMNIEKYIATVAEQFQKDAAVSTKTAVDNLMKEMAKNHRLWFNVRLVDGEKFIDKLSDSVIVGFGSKDIANNANLRAIVDTLRAGIPLSGGTVTSSGLQTVAAQTTVLLAADTTLHTGNADIYTSNWIPVLGKYGALNLSSFINVSGFGNSLRYASVQVQFSSDGVNFDGSFVALAVGFSDSNPSNLSIPILDNYVRLVVSPDGPDNYDWSAAGGSARTTLVGIPVGANSFVRVLGTSTVIGDVDPAAPGVMIAGRETANPTNSPLPWGMTATTGGEGIGQVIGSVTAITGNAIVTAERGGTTGTLTNVAEATSSTTLAASSTSRRGFAVFNDTANPLKLKFGSAVSATSFTITIAAGAFWQMPLPLYIGIITGISVGTGGFWRVTTW